MNWNISWSSIGTFDEAVVSEHIWEEKFIIYPENHRVNSAMQVIHPMNLRHDSGGSKQFASPGR